MLTVENDAVLVVIHIRRILEAPLAAVDGDGNDPVIFSGRMIQPPRVPFIFLAELAFRIAALFRQTGCRDGLGILLRLGKVDGDINVSIDTFRHPADVPADPVAADVIRILTEFVKEIRCLHGAFRIMVHERPDHLGRPRHQASHQLRVKQVSAGNAVVLQNAGGIRLIQQIFQDFL